MRNRLLALCLVALAGGCGQADDAFNKEFDANFRASCIAAASKGGKPEALVAQVCDCTLAGINTKFSTADKMTLTSEQAQPIATECLTKAVQQ